MQQQDNSVAKMPELHARMPRIDPRFRLYWRWRYRLRALWRHWRTLRPVTRWLGRQYHRSRDMIEIDITYLCNLHCLNCNRSATQAPQAWHMPVAMVGRFVDESIARDKRWRRIRVLGGEPTLHPEFEQIIAELQRYQRRHPTCIVEVVSNGYGERVQRELEQLPPGIDIDNSQKTGPVQPAFGPFNMAPIDDWKYAWTDYTNGCAIMEVCGMGLTPMGYYPCAVAGGIDRIMRDDLGSPQLPNDDDDMEQAASRLCRLCGCYRAGHFIPRLLRKPLTTERMSPTWQKLYKRWNNDRAKPQVFITLTVEGRAGDEHGHGLTHHGKRSRHDPTKAA